MIDENLNENVLVYSISYKKFIGPKPLRIKFSKIDAFIRVYDGTRYSVLFGPERCDAIYNRIRYIIGQKSGITYAVITKEESKLIHIIFRQKKCWFFIIFWYSFSQSLKKIKVTTIITYFPENAHINNTNMLYYDRIDVFEGMNINKTCASKRVILVTIGVF